MDGPEILAQTLSAPRATGKNRLLWQYHSRGTRHSITPCWGVLLDLLANSELLRNHVESGKVVFGLDHSMHDFRADRSKNLDLVIARPEHLGHRTGRTFQDLIEKNGIRLSDEQRDRMEVE